MITLLRFRRLEAAVIRAGFLANIQWTENLRAPADADEFARAAIYVIANSGMKNSVAAPIYDRCIGALESARKIRRVFGHPGKAKAMETIWRKRRELFERYLVTKDRLQFCASLPWIGPVTKFHLSRDLGADVAKPDVHLLRLARRDRTSVERMCRRLALQSGYRIGTVDILLWRACEQRTLDSRRYELHGWKAAFKP